LTPLFRRDSAPLAQKNEAWVEPVISDLMGLVNELRTEVVTLRRQVARLQKSAGRGLTHPSEIIEGWQLP
jgi:hypothetical protein